MPNLIVLPPPGMSRGRRTGAGAAVAYRPVNLAELAERSVEEFGEYGSLIFQGTTLTNVEQLAAAHRLADALVGLGLEPGARVAVMMPNAPEVFQAYGGIIASGGVVVPIVFILAVPEVRHIIQDCSPRFVLTGPELYPSLLLALDALPDPPIVIVTGPAERVPQGAVAFEALLSGADERCVPVERKDDDLAVIMYTGGTTGRPKGVMITHGNLIWMAEALAAGAAGSVRRDGMSLLALPVSHMFGMIASITGQVLGSRGVLLPWFEAGAALQAIQTHRVTYLPMVPAMAVMLLNHPERDAYDTSSLETILLSAAPVTVELKQRLTEAFGCEVVEAYGQTEASPAISIEYPGEEKRQGSCGRPVEGVEVAILDKDGAEVPRGAVGEICARSPGVMRGYFGRRDASEEALAGGWLHTGDMGFLDNDGFLYVTDRKKDLIIRGGENVYPRDVEDVLSQHPAVLESAVVGRPDPTFGEEVAAFVVLCPGQGVGDGELEAFCRERMAKFEAPKEIYVVASLPRSPIGKILKKELRTQLAARTSRPGEHTPDDRTLKMRGSPRR
jgi:long-chain acyl-CoA synthetase